MKISIIALVVLVGIVIVYCAPTTNQETKNYTNILTHLDEKILHESKYLVSRKQKLQTRVFGGKKAKKGQFPYQVRISTRDSIDDSNGKYLCGGTLISEQHVLTAAHCFYENNKRTQMAVKVILGDIIAKDSLNPLDKDRQKYKVDAKNIIIHEHFNLEKLNNDIAIIVLPKKLIFSKYIKPANLPSRNRLTFSGEIVRAAGWGRIGSGPKAKFSNTLLYTDLKIVEHSKCSKIYKSYSSLYELCTEGEKTDVCKGDSGGGHILTKTNTIIGITSRGLDCDESQPGVVTNVVHYLDWISRHTGINVGEPVQLKPESELFIKCSVNKKNCHV